MEIITKIVMSGCSEGRERFERWLSAGDLTIDAYGSMWPDFYVFDLVWLLSRLPPEHAERIRLCSDSNWYVRGEAVSGLSPEHAERIRLCSDSNWYVRRAAVAGLPPEHAERIRLCSDSNWEIREEAVSGLSPEHAERIRLCSDSNWYVREAAVSGRPSDYTLLPARTPNATS